MDSNIFKSTSQEEKDLRSRQSIQHLKDEIEVLLVRSTNFKKQFEETDTKVGTFLEEETSDLTVRKYLQTLWKNDCQNEESTTHKIWENKESSHRSTYKKEKEEETIHTLIINQESSVSPGNSNNITMVSIEEATTCREITTKVREEATNPNSNDLENHLVLGTNPLNKAFGANHNKDSGIDRNKIIGISHCKVFGINHNKVLGANQVAHHEVSRTQDSLTDTTSHKEAVSKMWNKDKCRLLHHRLISLPTKTQANAQQTQLMQKSQLLSEAEKLHKHKLRTKLKKTSKCPS